MRIPIPKHISTVFLSVLFTVLLPQTSCNRDKGWEESNLGNVSFEIVSSDYERIVGREGKPYHPDTIQVYNQAWEVKPLRKRYHDQPGQESWVFGLNYLEGKVPADTDFQNLDKTFYLYLNQHDVDTMRIVGRPDKVFVNGKELKGAPNSLILQYGSYFYLKD